MPRTASTQRTRASIQSPAAKTRRAQTPVLFRLPEIALTPIGAEVEDEPVATSVAPPPLETDTPVGARGSVDLDSPASLQAAGYDIAAEPTGMADDNLAVDVEAVVQPKPDVAWADDDERSWWEHWSSGVVLIVLVIALVTASILAFKDSEPTVPNELMDDSIDLESLAVVEDATAVLDSIEIPSLPANASQTVDSLKPAVPEAKPEQSAPAEAVSEIEELQLSGASTSQAPAQSTVPEANLPNATVAESSATGGQDLATGTPAAPGSDSLVPQDLDSLIPDASAIQAASFDGQASATSGVPANATSAGQTQTSASQTQTALLPPIPGVTAGQPEAAGSATSTAETGSSAGTGLPPYEQVLGLLPGQSRYPTVSGESHPEASFTTAQHQQAAPTGDAESTTITASAETPTSNTQLMQTSTPEADLELLMQRYQEFRAQAEQAAATNRYPSP